jgi:transcriptional regulator of arginine metabolism
MKSRRQEKILHIIAAHDVDTQEELIERLRTAGFETTQATVSRDIRELKLAKVMTGVGTYKYVRHGVNENTHPHINGALTDSITRIEAAGNILVIHTFVGMAQAIAATVDALKISEIVGCVAGDDTIIAVIRTEAQARELAEKLRLMIRGEK